MATPLSLDCVPTTGGFASPPFDGFAVYTAETMHRRRPGRNEKSVDGLFQAPKRRCGAGLSPKGVIRLADFGVAGARRGGDGRRNDDPDRELADRQGHHTR